MRVVFSNADLLRPAVVPAHCTGFRAVHALLNAFGETVVMPSAVGSRYLF